MTESIRTTGTIHGQTIELERPISLAEGEVVDITITRRETELSEPLLPGEGIRRSAGAWAEDAEEIDAFLEWNRQQRKHSRPEIQP